MQDDQGTARRIVVGLGNPGRRYARTRHNLGFRVVDVLADRWQASGPREAFDGLLLDARATRSGHEQHVLMLQPQTYMNCSGRSVRALAEFYRVAPQDVLVVLDDLALAPGRIRARAEGSAGGHKGLTDIIEALGGPDVPRVRIGIGPPPPRMDAADFVLQTIAPDEEELFDPAVQIAADAVEDWVFEGVRFVMDRYNGKQDS